MTEQEELYAKFYNMGKVLVVDMDTIQLREHIETLSQIAFEAKATLAAAHDELRERKAKTTKREWTLTPTGPDANVTDAINAVKIRKDRMSKMDRLALQLRGAGIDEETVKEMVTNLERKATEKSLKTVTFTKSTTELAAVTVKTVKEAKDSSAMAPAFNPASLSFNQQTEGTKR